MKGERVAQLELILRSHPEGLRKSEIARRIGVHRSTIGRYIEELKQFSDVYEDNNLIKIRFKDNDEQLSLSVYESLAINLGAEMLLTNSEFQNPHLASGLRKIAMNMESYAPKISSNIMALAEDIEKAATEEKTTSYQNEILEVLIDAWISGKMVRIVHRLPSQNIELNLLPEEVELAPYFIGFVDNENGRKPITVTGRIRHTTEITTIEISKISSVTILNETYTIPDNLKAFRKMETPAPTDQIIDTVHLELLVSQKSAINSFDTLSHSPIVMQKLANGKYKCTFDAENSIELILRLVQCGDAVKILYPLSFQTKFKNYLSDILANYRD